MLEFSTITNFVWSKLNAPPIITIIDTLLGVWTAHVLCALGRSSKTNENKKEKKNWILVSSDASKSRKTT